MLIFFYGGKLLARGPTPKMGGSSLVGCSRQLIQYVRNSLPYLKACPPSVTWGHAVSWRQLSAYYEWGNTM